MPGAWLTGATGAWGSGFGRALLASGYDIVCLGRSAPAWASMSGGGRARVAFLRLDLEGPIPEVDALLAGLPEPAATLPDVLIHPAVAVEGEREAILRADFLGPSTLIASVAEAMVRRGRGRIGVLVPQNARLGLRGMGDVAGAQAALWTWAESLAAELRATTDVRLTLVIPPRTASPTQRYVAARTGHAARLGGVNAEPLLRAVLAGRRRAGRLPLLAAAAMLRP
jgi:short-subunit dehydrogenase